MTEEDLDRIIERVEPLSFRIGLDLIKNETLKIFFNEMEPILDNLSVKFDLLEEEDKKTVILWILASFLPKILEKLFKQNYTRLRNHYS